MSPHILMPRPAGGGLDRLWTAERPIGDLPCVPARSVIRVASGRAHSHWKHLRRDRHRPRQGVRHRLRDRRPSEGAVRRYRPDRWGRRQMDKVPQQNAASAEESSSAAEELAGRSEERAAMVGPSRSPGRRAPRSMGPPPTRRSTPRRPGAPFSHRGTLEGPGGHPRPGTRARLPGLLVPGSAVGLRDQRVRLGRAHAPPRRPGLWTDIPFTKRARDALLCSGNRRLPERRRGGRSPDGNVGRLPPARAPAAGTAATFCRDEAAGLILVT